MPTYTYECLKCEKEFERVLHMSEFDTQQTCGCGGVGKRVIAIRQKEPTFTDKLFGGGRGYYDTSLNKVFSSQSERRSWLKKHGYVNTGGDHMTKKQERAVYAMRQWGKNARHARRD